LVDSPSGGRWGAGGAAGGAQQLQLDGSARDDGEGLASAVDSLATINADLRRAVANVSELDDDELTALQNDIASNKELLARAKEDLAKIQEDLAGIAASHDVVASEVTRRRCAEAEAKDNPDFVCPISHSLMRWDGSPR
jgi:hypothetical protein